MRNAQRTTFSSIHRHTFHFCALLLGFSRYSCSVIDWARRPNLGLCILQKYMQRIAKLKLVREKERAKCSHTFFFVFGRIIISSIKIIIMDKYIVGVAVSLPPLVALQLDWHIDWYVYYLGCRCSEDRFWPNSIQYFFGRYFIYFLISFRLSPK